MLKRVLRYDTTYLSKEIVLSCFEQNKHNFVDKVICGNGYTTSFLKIQPSNTFQSNIIIVPNRQVVISKQNSYNKNTDSNKVKIGFIYGDDSADKINFKEFDVMMFVVDSFLNYQDILIKNKDLIDKIMVDEAHSFPIQSVYRNRLVDFSKFVSSSFTDKAIVSVTATPMLFQRADIKIIPTDIDNRFIHISQNQQNTLDRIKDKLAANEKVVIALQDARILKRLTDSKNVLNASIKVGKTMFQKILENVVLEYNADSNLTIISSAGFEGFDVDNGINNIFIFEDRSTDYQTFYSQNIAQIIGRSRKGTDYIEWCRMSNLSRTPLLSKDDMIKMSESKKISFEKKMTDKNYTFIPKFFDVDYSVNFGLITALKLNDEKYDLQKELNDADLLGMRIYKDFFTDRGFSLKYLDDGTKRLNLKTPSHQKAFDTVKLNKSVLERFELFTDIRLNIYPKDKTTLYIKELEVFLRRKYWSADKLPFEMLDYEYLHLSKDIHNEMKCYNILTDAGGLDKSIKAIVSDRVKYKKGQINRKSKEYKVWEKDLTTNILDRYIRLNMAFSQPKFKIPNKVRNSRNYSLVTEVSMGLIKKVSLEYNTLTTEADIVTCNPRIIYAFCGLELPADFYGVDKVNKQAINKLLNTLSEEHPTQYNLNISNYKKNRIKDLRKYGFNEKVISFLISTFWCKPKDSLFNFCAYHEKEIINKLTAKLIKISDNSNYNLRYVRRHDSVIVVGNITPLKHFDDGFYRDIKNIYHEIPKAISDFEYLGITSWFKDYIIEERKDVILEDKVAALPY